MKLDLKDLLPEDSNLELSGKQFTLNKMTLRGRIWMQKKFTEDKIKQIFSDLSFEEISEIAYFLLKEKDQVKSVEDLQDLVVTQQDRVNLIQSMMATIGLSEPVVKKLSESTAPGNEESLSQPTGANTTT
jgi:hypothetical protein